MRTILFIFFSLICFLQIFLQTEPALSFAPNHQEACCLKIIRKESTAELRCDGFQLNDKICESILANFSKAAQAHAKQSHIVQPPTEPNIDASNAAASPRPKRTSFSKSDVRVILVFAAIVFAGVVLFFLVRRFFRASRLKSSLLLIPRLLNVLFNAIGIGLIAWAIVLKSLCSIGDACRVGTGLIAFFIPSALIGAFAGFKYLLSGWRNRERPWTKELLTSAILIAMFIATYQLKLSIP